MYRILITTLAALLAFSPKAPARSDLPAGNYIVYYAPNATLEQGLFLINVERKGGKDVAKVLDPKDDAEVESIKVDEGNVTIVFKAFGRTLSFEGAIDPKDDKKIVGSFGDDNLITRGRLVPTEKEMLGMSDRVLGEVPEPMMAARRLREKVQMLRSRLRQLEGDAAADTKKELEDAQKEFEKKAPALYRDVIEKYSDSPAVVDSLLALLPGAERSAKPEDVAKWVKTVDAFAGKYGPRYRLSVMSRALGALSNLKGFEKVSLETAEAAAGALVGASAGQQVKVLKALKLAQEKAGKADAAGQTDAKIAKLEEELDREYLARVPPFKPTQFRGRKEKSERVVAMELFTGAECPPCVAADAAFDGLLKAYKPTDVVFVQYHMHIPGPDPLTNPSTIARWDYYTKLKVGLRGVPSALFNGKPDAGGGGGMANAEAKFKEYREAIDPLLDEPTDVKLTGAVAKKGADLEIKVEASGVKEGSDAKIRLLVVEQSIRYLGGNGVRFHHHVVRDMPGGPEGFAVKGGKGAASATVSLEKLRSRLNTYLDEFVADEGPFANPERPLRLKDLRIIALVQDDESGQILQALQMDVPETR